MPDPSQHEFGFAYMVFGVAPPPADVRVVFLPVPDRLVVELARKLRPKVAEPLPPVPDHVQKQLDELGRRGQHPVAVAPTVYSQIDVPGYPPLHAAIDRHGLTAMRVTWIHRMTVEVATGRAGGAAQAVSLYLTGLDRDADNGAISAAEQLRLGPQRTPLPLDKLAWKKVRNDPRPVAVQIFLQPLARMDPSIQCGFLALGAAFFGTLGVECERGGEGI